MGATSAFLLPSTADGKADNHHCSHTCSIVLLCTIVPFCVLTVLFLVFYATCGHRYMIRKRRAREWQRQRIEMETRKFGDEDSMLSWDAEHPRGRDGLALEWGPLRERDLEPAPAPPPILKTRPGSEQKSAVAKASKGR